ncbi:hypothetical protein LRS06_07375 [Hymenobacter sp. J193]|uniref:hypothetical protein n=1 Tax=Hymenobacter sp. J193 TaxID=2898429 RepID=UPI00215125FB|nr:hypothetical protein [Hymenobacter sp. J193]MCR5887599.1 hypothetical protein [Hymenobacter sp. J193]
MKQRFSWVGWLLVFFVLLDLTYSFRQYYQIPLDGDLSSIALPGPSNSPVLTSPLGIRAWRNQEYYLGPNRYFAYAFTGLYFHHVPRWLQVVFSPIDSVYVACALLKALAQAALVYLLGIMATGTWRLTRPRLWLAMALVTPIFQVKGYAEEMAVVDWCISYASFYAVPVIWLLVYLLPFHLAAWFGRPLLPGTWWVLLWLLLAVVLALSGPLIPALLLLLAPSLMLRLLVRGWQQSKEQASWPGRFRQALAATPWRVWLVLGFTVLMGLYSLYVGQYNIENTSSELAVKERYEKLWMGIYYELAGGLGVPVLLLVAVVNHYFLRALPLTPERRRLLVLGNWVFVLALVYLALLPLGGYRGYRPNVIRRDTLIPITLGLTFFFAISAVYLVRHLAGRWRAAYGAMLALFVFIYTNSDRPLDDAKTCERAALEYLQNSRETVTLLPYPCAIMAWSPTTNAPDSEVAMQMLARWRIVRPDQRFYQQP